MRCLVSRGKGGWIPAYAGMTKILGLSLTLMATKGDVYKLYVAYSHILNLNISTKIFRKYNTTFYNSISISLILVLKSLLAS